MEQQKSIALIKVRLMRMEEAAMATYCIGDIHGEYEKYLDMLDIIDFSDEDTLFVIGDVIDRGHGGISILKDMMMRPNVIPIIGNHEYMAVSCLKFLLEEVTDEGIDRLATEIHAGLLEWINVGGMPTMQAFRDLPADERLDIIDYLEEFELFAEVSCGGNDYVLVHAGISNFDPSYDMDEYDISELIFESPDYDEVYFPDKYLVTGHLPTFAVGGGEYNGKIYRMNNHIAIDCGCSIGGRLGAICLDSGEEFYVE